MTTADKKVVWVLGSGFSRGLGGPLLYELLSPKAQRELKAKFPEVSFVPAHLIFQKYSATSPNPVAVLWEHAEQFLEFVDSATDKNSPRHRLAFGLLREAAAEMHSVEELWSNSAKAVLAECLFTTLADPKTDEVWKPYRSWAASLRPDRDTVVTFNYDLVLETLGALPEMRFIGQDTVAQVGENGGLKVGPRGNVDIFKLHGSANWIANGKGYDFVPDPTDILKSDAEPLIAVPGRTKTRHTNGAFRRLWEETAGRLKDADVIVFLGYRFPPSDSESRFLILNAIKENKKPYVRIHTVLGPHIGHEHTVRLVKLLEATLEGAGRRKVEGRFAPQSTADQGIPSFSVIAQPLYVEDFFSVLHHRELYG